MKALLLFAAIIGLSSIAVAKEVTSINCAYESKFYTAKVGDPSNYMLGSCEGFSTNQNICFIGDEQEGVEILKALNEDGILGDEYSMRRFRARKSALKYDIYDGPNGEVLQGIAIPRCSNAPVKEVSTEATQTEVSEDLKYRCTDVAQDAVIMARKQSLRSDWEISAKAIVELNGDVVMKVELFSQISNGSSTDYFPEGSYEVKVKANCDIVSVVKIVK